MVCIILRDPSFLLLSLLIDYTQLTNDCNKLIIHDFYAATVILVIKEMSKVESVDLKLTIQTLYVSLTSLYMIPFSRNLSDGVVNISYYVMGECLYNIVNIVILLKIK